ncbi:MAG TPA: helix-turn-helix domain-containing protein [Longimicrobium sp.]|nr:helix-turn-helix domain-containing protein [Longimicrobium sp.]
MNQHQFDQLCESVREAGGYLRGEPADVRVTFVGGPDPRAIRERLGMTQERFAAVLCIGVKTLRNWEQGRRDPSGPAPPDRRQASRGPARRGLTRQVTVQKSVPLHRHAVRPERSSRAKRQASLSCSSGEGQSFRTRRSRAPESQGEGRPRLPPSGFFR